MMDIQDFDALWQSGLPKAKDAQNFWDLRAEEFNGRVNTGQGEQRRKKLLDYLAARDLLPAKAKILDIGCGPGSFALAFAKTAGQVDGIDISPNMVRYARENASQENRDNAVFEVADWETLDLEERGWTQRYDLVFASMCPGINSSATLLKMCRASKGACFMSSFAEREGDLRDELHRYIYGQEPGRRWGRNIYCAVNILFLSGYYPEIAYHDAEWDNAWPVAQAAEIYGRQLKQSDAADPDIDEKIAAYLGGIAVNGMVRETVRAKIAWVSWRVGYERSTGA